MTDKKWFGRMQHPNKQDLLAYCCAELPAGKAGKVSAHLEACEECRQAAERLTEDLKIAEQVALAGVPQLKPGDVQSLRKRLAELAQAPFSDDPAGAAVRITRELSPYLGVHAQTLLKECGHDPKRLIERAEEILRTFLGRQAAFAVKTKLSGG